MRIHCALVPCFVGLLAGALAAQPLPLADPFVLSWPYTPNDSSDSLRLSDPFVAALSTGGFAVASAVRHERDGAFGVGVETRLVHPAGQIDGGRPFHGFGGVDPGDSVACPALAPTSDGGFVLVDSYSPQTGAFLEVERFGPGAISRGSGVVREPPDGVADSCPAVIAAPTGRYVITWPEVHFGSNAFTTFLAQWFRPKRTALGPPRALDAPLAGEIFTPPAVGMDGAGRAVVVWRGTSAPGLLAQRFDPAGTPLGAPFRVAETYAAGPALAMAQDGGFVVAWIGTASPGSTPTLLLRRFAADGTPLTPPVEAGVGEVRGDQEGYPLASSDHHGNFVVAWKEESTTRARLFNRSLVPQGEAFDLGPASPNSSFVLTRFALADSGRLLAVWEAPSPTEPRIVQTVGQLWQARHEADLCLYRGVDFLCDTAGEGPITEILQLGLGRPLYTPLLGDVDGDGRADPCVRRGNAFVCDTAHDGGNGEVLIRFGLASDTPLLGDIDRDGRADPCVHRGNLFLCDNAHDGGTPEVTIGFGRADDIPLLGDVDGDGRADPCVYRQGLFLCDMAHNGGTAEVKLDLRPALGGDTSGVPLLGDVEGIGRADACLYRGGTLTCGQFAPGGGRPLSTFTRATAGQPGDVPMLGDLDAF